METEISQKTETKLENDYSSLWVSLIEKNPSLALDSSLPKETIDEKIERIRIQRLKKELFNLDKLEAKIRLHRAQANSNIKKQDPLIDREDAYWAVRDNKVNFEPEIIVRHINPSMKEYLTQIDSILGIVKQRNYVGCGSYETLEFPLSREDVERPFFVCRLKNYKTQLESKLEELSLVDSVFDPKGKRSMFQQELAEVEYILKEDEATPYSPDVKRSGEKKAIDYKIGKNKKLTQSFITYFDKKQKELSNIIDREYDIKSSLEKKVNLPISLRNVGVNKDSSREYGRSDQEERCYKDLISCAKSVAEYSIKIEQYEFVKRLTFPYSSSKEDYEMSLQKELANLEEYKISFEELKNTPYLDRPKTLKCVDPYEARTLSKDQWEAYKQEHLNP